MEESRFPFHGRQPRNMRPPIRYGKALFNPSSQTAENNSNTSSIPITNNNSQDVKGSDLLLSQRAPAFAKNSSDPIGETHPSFMPKKTSKGNWTAETNAEWEARNTTEDNHLYHKVAVPNTRLEAQEDVCNRNLNINFQESGRIHQSSEIDRMHFKASVPTTGEKSVDYDIRKSKDYEKLNNDFTKTTVSDETNVLPTPPLSGEANGNLNFKHTDLEQSDVPHKKNDDDKRQLTFPTNEQTLKSEQSRYHPYATSLRDANKGNAIATCLNNISEGLQHPQLETNKGVLERAKSTSLQRALDAAAVMKQFGGRKSPETWYRCPSCNYPITWPHLLNCFHQFCFRCLTKFYEVTKKEIKCSTCSFLTPVGERGPVDLRLDMRTCQEIIEMDCNPFSCMTSTEHDNAYKYCNTCMLFFCLRCVEEHKQNWQTAGHNLTDVPKYYYAEDKLYEMCNGHPSNALDRFCMTCQTMVCFTCTVYGQMHWRHPLCKDGDKARKRKQTLTIEADRIRDHVRRQIQPMILKKQEIENKARACKRSIHLFSNHLIDTVSKKRLEARIHLDKAYDEVSQNINVFEELTGQFSKDYRSLAEFTDRYLKDPVPSFLLPVSSKLMDNFKNILGKWEQIDKLQGLLEVDIMFSPEFPIINDVITQSYQIDFFESLDNLVNSDTDMGRVLRQNMEVILKKQSHDIVSRFKTEFADRENGFSTNTEVVSDGESEFYYSRNGVNSIHTFGDFGKGDYLFGEPSGVTYLSDGSLAVCDTSNHRIMIFDEKYIFARTIGEPPHMVSSSEEDNTRHITRVPGCLYYPYRLAECPKTKNIIVVERPPSRAIQIFTENGQFVRRFGNDVLRHPRGVVVDEDGIIVVVEGRTMKLMLFAQNGSVIQTFHLCVHLEFPNDVAAKGGIIYISDNRGHCVHLFDYDGRSKGSIGNESVTYYPIGVSTNKQDQVVVTDNHNTFNISVFDADGMYKYGLKSRVKHANCYNVALHPSRLELAVTSRDCQVIIFDYNEPQTSLVQ